MIVKHLTEQYGLTDKEAAEKASNKGYADVSGEKVMEY